MKMDTGIKKIISGFNFIDKNWGGFYKGGSYIVVGPRKSGKTLLSLQLAKESVFAGDKCLFFTTMRPRDLMIHSASMQFDIQKCMDKNQIIVVRVSNPNDSRLSDEPDMYLTDYINDISSIVKQYNPDKIFFDEITPYVGFKNISLLKKTFLDMLELIEEREVTSFFIIGEPATVKTQSIFNLISENVTALIYLNKKEVKGVSKNLSVGKIRIVPNIGHTEGEFESDYFFKPNFGIVTSKDESKDTLFYKNAVLFDKKEISAIFAFTNIYSFEDFTLILNNQIALYKSTGQQLSVLMIAPGEDGVTLEELVEKTKNICGKNEKICKVDEKMYVLFTDSKREVAEEVITELYHDLKKEYVQDFEFVVDKITASVYEINESVTDSEGLFKILDEQVRQNPKYLSLYE